MTSKPKLFKHPHFVYWLFGSLAFLTYFLFATFREFTSYAELKTSLIYAFTVQEYFGAWTTYIFPLLSTAMVLPFIYLIKVRNDRSSSNKILALVAFWVIISGPFLISIASLFKGPFKREEVVSVYDRQLGLRVSYVRTESSNYLVEDRIDILLMKPEDPWNRVSLYSGTEPDIYRNSYRVRYTGIQINITDPHCSVVRRKLENVQFNETQYKIIYESSPLTETG